MAGPGGRPMRILIADDDPVARQLVARTLGRAGYEVVSTADGTQAWGVLEAADPPPLAILDWMMPGLTGLEVCRRLRAGPARPAYVIVLTSRDRTEDLVEALEAGADDYIVKPFQAEELRARVAVGARVIGLQLRLAERVRDLEEALAHVQQLQGLIPICAWCRQVRNDQNFWERVESYLARRSGLQFTHAICPTCRAAVTADLEQGREPPPGGPAG